MKCLCLILLFSGLALGQSHEILRPTTDVDGLASIARAIDPTDCNTAQINASTVQPNWYDAGGLSTSSTLEITNGSPSSTRCISRVFKVWTTTTNTYTNLTLNINTQGQCNAGACGTGTVAYSLNAGSTWTIVHSATLWAQDTQTVTLSVGQNLSNIWVAGVAFANVNDGINNGDSTIIGFDVWTDGTYTPPMPTPTPTPATVQPPTVAHPVIISRLLEWLLAFAKITIATKMF